MPMQTLDPSQRFRELGALCARQKALQQAVHAWFPLQPCTEQNIDTLGLVCDLFTLMNDLCRALMDSETQRAMALNSFRDYMQGRNNPTQ